MSLNYIHADHLGRPVFVTDPSGAVIWDAGITTPFGQSYEAQDLGDTIQTMAAITQPLMFPGQYRDIETGYDDNWHRTYDPALGRYLQSDPIGLAGGLNRYAYVGGNPVGYIDPTGEIIPFILVGALIGGGFGVLEGYQQGGLKGALFGGLRGALFGGLGALPIGTVLGGGIAFLSDLAGQAFHPCFSGGLSGLDFRGAIGAGIFGAVAGRVGAGQAATGLRNQAQRHFDVGRLSSTGRDYLIGTNAKNVSQRLNFLGSILPNIYANSGSFLGGKLSAENGVEEFFAPSSDCSC